MKFTIAQNTLLEALQKVSGVVPARSTTPILENILFDLASDSLTITGTDLEVSISTEIAVENVEATGSVALPARVITEMIRSLPDIPIHFELDTSNRVKITTDQGYYQVGGIAKENFPEIPEMAEDTVIELSNDLLNRMFTKTIFAVSSDELRPALMGVYLQFQDAEFRMVATDGHRLSKIVKANVETEGKQIKMIVPPKAVQIALKNLTSTGRTRLVMSEKGLCFQLDKTLLFTRLVEGEYPDYERVIPRDNDKELRVDKSLLMASVKRVSLFSSALTHQIRFSVEPGKLTVYSEDVDIGGEAREEIAVDYNEEAMEIGYNAQYVQDIVRHVDTDEVAFHLKSPVRAALITPSQQNENESFHMLIMPIKLST